MGLEEAAHFEPDAHRSHEKMKPISTIALGLLSTCCFFGCCPGAAAGLLTEKELQEHGYFLFPQSEGRVLRDTKELRLSAWNNASLLYVQAILWNDDSMAVGSTDEGRQSGDSSTLSLDIDANQRVSPNFDRDYCLNPWLSMNGLYYSILLGRCSWTDIKNDSSGAGSICYVALADGRRVRVDSYVIPLKEIGKRVGEDIRLCFSAQSPVPPFEVNSVGDTNRPPKDGCYHIPLGIYHRIVLAKGRSLSREAVAVSWEADSESFSRSRAVTNSNERWFCSSYVHVDSPFDRVKLTNNTPEMIRHELASRTFLSDMGGRLGLASRDFAKLRFIYNSQYGWFELEQNGAPPSVFDSVREAVDMYVRARNEGHTKEFILAGTTSRVTALASEDAGIRAIAASRPQVPVSWLKLDETGATTNKAGQEVSRTITTTVVGGKTVTNEVVDIPKTDEVRPWASYTLVDGDLCWRYFVQFKVDGSVASVHDSKCDAKDVDPKYKALMKEVESAVEQDMKKEGSSGQFGSCHRFWQLKEEKLKQKGIDWRSPAEVNPDTCYD